MESFVRSLLRDSAEASGSVRAVMDEVAQRWAHGSPAQREQPDFAAHLVRRAVWSQAARELGSAGEIPMLAGPALWAELLDPAPEKSELSELTLLLAPTQRQRAHHWLRDAGWQVYEQPAVTWLRLPALSTPPVCLREELPGDGLFAANLPRLRARAILDERLLGTLVLRPSAEDSMALWVASAGEGLLAGRAPNLALAARLQERLPGNAAVLEAVWLEHGLTRLGRTLLPYAAERTQSASLQSLVAALGRAPAAGRLLAPALAASGAARASRILGSAAAYALAGDKQRLSQALGVRAERAKERVLARFHT